MRLRLKSKKVACRCGNVPPSTQTRRVHKDRSFGKLLESLFGCDDEGNFQWRQLPAHRKSSKIQRVIDFLRKIKLFTDHITK